MNQFIQFWIKTIFEQENLFENVVCKLASILFPPQCVKFELKLH